MEGRAYSAAKSTGLGLAEKEEATNADVLGIGIGGYRLKQAAEQLSIYIILLRLLLLLDPLLRHSMKLPADPSSVTVRYTNLFCFLVFLQVGGGSAREV